MAETEEEPEVFLKKLRNLRASSSSNNICVVGVFGKGASGAQSKGIVLNRLLDKHIFQTQNLFERSQTEDALQSCYIEPYYDADRGVLYLHLVSVYDGAQLAQLCRQLPQHVSAADSHAYWKSHEEQHARFLLYLFTVCHIMIVCQPRAIFDTSYVKLFRALQSIREKLIGPMSASLKPLSIGRQWQSSGRMCTPRLLFISQQSDLNQSQETEAPGNDGKNKKKSPRKVLQHHLEDQIYRIFRKTHILTNNMSHCLFSIPLNQAFVHILRAEDQLKDPTHELINSCTHIDNHDNNKGKEVFVMPVTMDVLPSLGEKVEDSLKSFVNQHVDLILAKKGFDDNLRGSAIAHFEYPSLKTWTEVAISCHELFMNSSDDPKVTPALSSLRTALDQDLRFSEMRCKKILPMANRSYQENASSHYTSTVHRNKLLQAMKLYSQHARGPAYETFARQLQEECEHFWQSGRQLCEVISLTGHHCIHKLHLLPDDPELDSPRDIVLSRLPHTNNNKTPCACNCGRTWGTREDPFDAKVANLDFFEELEEKCCRKLHHVTFPTHVPPPSQRPAPSDAQGESTSALEGEAAQHDGMLNKAMENIKLSTDPKDSQSGVMTPELNLSQSETIEGSVPMDQQGTGIALSTQEEHSAKEDEKDKADMPSPQPQPQPQPQHLRALEGMLCNTTPRGMLPRFSSWSLICLGPASLYNHSKGLDQKNFLRDSKHLLPWDIPIPKGSVMDSIWPSPSETITTSKKGGRGRDKKDGSWDGLRAYIGNEYECPRSHRFLCSGPDKVVKVASGSGGPKENANKLVTLDMPLYYPCPCRTNKPPLGQLIRSFIVTPPPPVYIKLNPRVRPGPHPTPTFMPLPGEEGVTLSASSLWVLRYPFVYVSEAGPVLPPADNQPTPGAKLLKGLYLVTLQPPPTP